MKVHVNQKICETAGVCVQICPEIFRFEPGSKKAVAAAEDVPPSLQEKCVEAAEKCPAGAICVDCGSKE